MSGKKQKKKETENITLLKIIFEVEEEMEKKTKNIPP